MIPGVKQLLIYNIRKVSEVPEVQKSRVSGKHRMYQEATKKHHKRQRNDYDVRVVEGKNE